MGVEKAPKGKGFTSASLWDFHGTAPKGGCLNRDDYNAMLIPEITEPKSLCHKVARSSRSFFTCVRGQKKTTAPNGENQGDRHHSGRRGAMTFSFDSTPNKEFVQDAMHKMVGFHCVLQFIPVNVPGGQVYESRQVLENAIRAFATVRTATSATSVQEDWCIDWALRLRDNDDKAIVQGGRMTIVWYYLKSLYNDMHDEEKRDITPASILQQIGFHKIVHTFTMCLMMERRLGTNVHNSGRALIDTVERRRVGHLRGGLVDLHDRGARGPDPLPESEQAARARPRELRARDLRV